MNPTERTREWRLKNPEHYMQYQRKYGRHTKLKGQNGEECMHASATGGATARLALRVGKP
jgi:hypothetical protein